MVSIIEARLKQHGYEVRSCVSGLTAVREAREWLPDMVVCEYQLPEMRGDVLTRELGRVPALSHVPVVVFTWLEATGVEEKCFEAGARAVIYKPIVRDLVDKMQRIFAGIPDDDFES
jgi:CheY-like chemotaxis protein